MHKAVIIGRPGSGAGRATLQALRQGGTAGRRGRTHAGVAGYRRRGHPRIRRLSFVLRRRTRPRRRTWPRSFLFTGAGASLRGRAGYGAFNSAKAGLCTLAQAIAKEYGPQGIHVGHVVVDGAVDGEKIRRRFPDADSRRDRMIDIEGIVSATPSSTGSTTRPGPLRSTCAPPWKAGEIMMTGSLVRRRADRRRVILDLDEWARDVAVGLVETVEH
jgi:hypothetical protein